MCATEGPAESGGLPPNYEGEPLAFYFQSVDVSRNRHRHYLLTVERDLFGRLIVVRRWGRIGARGWQGSQSTSVDTPADVVKILKEVLRRRRQHHYRVTEGQGILADGL